MLCVLGHRVINIFYLVRGFLICKTTLEITSKTRYFREELKQRIWGRTCPCPLQGPKGSCSLKKELKEGSLQKLLSYFFGK